MQTQGEVQRTQKYFQVTRFGAAGEKRQAPHSLPHISLHRFLLSSALGFMPLYLSIRSISSTRCFREAYTGLPVVHVTENQKALNCVVLKYSIPVSEE